MRYFRPLTSKFVNALLLAALVAGSPTGALAQEPTTTDKPVVGPTQTVEQSIEALFGDDTGEKPQQPTAPKSDEPIIYISDTDNGRIVMMQGIEGDGFSSLGLPGYGFGRFLRPCQIWVDYKHRVYVADSGNNRVVRMDKESASGWSEYDGLSNPQGIAVGRKGVYVADTDANRVLLLDDVSEKGKVLDTITNDQMTRPTSLWLDADDSLYICCGEDPPGGKVVKTWMDKDRRRFKMYEGEELSGSRFRPSSLVTVGRSIKFLDGSGNRIIDMQDMEAHRLRERDYRTDREYRLSRPQGIGVDQSGKRFFVADSGNDRILELGPNGEVLAEFFGLRGDPNSVLRNPKSVFVYSPNPEPDPEPDKDDKKKKKKH